MFRLMAALMMVGVALVAGCGDDEDDGGDRLGKEEFSTQMNGISGRVDREFGEVFEKLGRRGEKQTVPADVKAEVLDAARVEREVVEELDSLNPPEDAEEAAQDLVDAGGAQADALEQAAEDPELTVGALADIFEQSAVQDALAELEKLGYVTPDESR